jgi:tripartite-type tricarboxylate transporter receptor subunit TctC
MGEGREFRENKARLIRRVKPQTFYGGIIMKLPRRQFLHLAAGAAASPAALRVAWAQSYPTRPVRIIVGYPPGGANSTVARLVAQWLQDRLGQPFTVENLPGAANNLATEAVVRAPGNGYTLLLADSANAINATLYDKLNFNFIRDIAPVASIMAVPLVFEVNPSVPARTVPEFIAYAKAHPGKINMASGGSGHTTHLSGELFKSMTGVDGGQVQAYFGLLPASIEYIRADKLRALAVTTATRAEILPDLPTVGEVVPRYEASSWFGISAPKNTPPEIIAKLNKEINEALADPKFKARLSDLGGIVLAHTPAEFGELVAEDTVKWGKVIRAANIKPV